MQFKQHGHGFGLFGRVCSQQPMNHFKKVFKKKVANITI